MKKQSMVGLFFSMFLRATVIILAIVIVVFGVVFISKVAQKEDGKNKGPATTASPNVLTEAEGHDELLYTDPSETTEYITAVDTEATEATTTEILMSYDANILLINYQQYIETVLEFKGNKSEVLLPETPAGSTVIYPSTKSKYFLFCVKE